MDIKIEPHGGSKWTLDMIMDDGTHLVAKLCGPPTKLAVGVDTDAFKRGLLAEENNK